ncbi:MAG: hypothetical protein GY711_11660 [bacterium]|nr:hypothetical protein [bacterium]
MSENETPRRSDVASPNSQIVTIALPSGLVVPVQLLAAHHPIAAITIPSGPALDMPVGFTPALTLRDADGVIVSFETRALTRQHSAGSDRYELKILSGSLAERRRLYRLGARIAQEQGPYEDNELHETRKTYRVRPDSEQRSGITLGLIHGTEVRARFEAQLLDVSLTGLSTVTEVDTEHALSGVDEILIHFDPCFFGHQLTYPAEIRYRFCIKNGVRYGLEFANQGSLDYKRFQLVLTQYVMRRQRENLPGRSA